MSILETVKRNGKTIVGVVAGLAIAGASLVTASSAKKTDDYDEGYEPDETEESEETTEEPSEEEASEE